MTADDHEFRERASHWLTREPNTMILQPTSLCPLACKYCYLPERHLKQEMSVGIIEAVISGIPSEWFRSKTLEVVWHGGEPLAIGLVKFEALLNPFEQLRSEGRVQQRVQTNATLISDEWCELFTRYDFDIGVSIDGPPHTNHHRVDRGGRPMFDRIIAGIDTLKKHGLSFTTLGVVTTESVDKASETLSFFAELGCTWVGLNVEAREAANVTGKAPTIEQARDFWREAFEWSTANPGMTIREVQGLARFLAFDSEIRLADARHDLIPTIGWNGDVVLLSPELLGVQDATYGDFAAGNVLVEPLSTILDGASRLSYVHEFMDGLEECKRTCEFWNFCQGAHAGNRYFEHGTFRATETNHCQVSFQAPVLALAEILREST